MGSTPAHFSIRGTIFEIFPFHDLMSSKLQSSVSEPGAKISKNACRIRFFHPKIELNEDFQGPRPILKFFHVLIL